MVPDKENDSLRMRDAIDCDSSHPITQTHIRNLMQKGGTFSYNTEINHTKALQ